ncbi:MAG: hypothetical protein JWQ67_2131, partial [Marmoricola sp.]|nr:hypothetical protein [Marmoricola sp.]
MPVAPLEVPVEAPIGVPFGFYVHVPFCAVRCG